MKILLIHYRYSLIGGPERYLFNIKKLLEENNHEVIPFSIEYSNNQIDKYSHYFVKPPSDEFHAHKMSKFSFAAVMTGINMIYNISAYKNLNRLVNDTKPDIAYVLLFSKLSVSIFRSLKKNNIPIVLRISDFSYFCSRGVFMRDLELCEKCINCSFQRVIYKCTKDSLLFSVLDYIRRAFEKISGYLNYVDQLIIPSTFTASYYERHKFFPKAKIKHLPTFSSVNNTIDIAEEKIYRRFNNKQIIFFGRISEEKGIEYLLRAFILLSKRLLFNFSLHIVGFTDSEYSIRLKKFIEENKMSNVFCYDFLEVKEINRLLDESTFSIVPSICYDNMPNSLIESQALGLPVIASNLGSFPELIKDQYNGFLFENKNLVELANTIESSLQMDMSKYLEMSKNSYHWAQNYCSRDKHYQEIIEIFNKYVK